MFMLETIVEHLKVITAVVAKFGVWIFQVCWVCCQEEMAWSGWLDFTVMVITQLASYNY
jgi:hypothetical protein